MQPLHQDSDDEDNEIKQREKKFVLDGVTCAANYNADLMYRRASREALLPPPVKKTELSLKIHRNAQSSKYGDVIPERYIGQRPQTADAIPSFRFDKKSALDEVCLLLHAHSVHLGLDLTFPLLPPNVPGAATVRAKDAPGRQSGRHWVQFGRVRAHARPEGRAYP